MEVCGNERIKFVPFGFYYYYLWNAPKGRKIDCYIQHMAYEEYKLRTYIPLQKLRSIDDVPEPVPNYKCPEPILKRLEVEINKLK